MLKLLEDPKTAPLLIYGTSWKGDETAELTETALKLGFTGVDTANYPASYNEALTGDGIAAALASGIKREDLFIQSKFTPLESHGTNKPAYNPDQDIEGQVKESILQSLDHLGVDYLDALLLHGPYDDDADSLVAWKAFESFVPGRIRRLGASNVSLPQLQKIYEGSSVKPVIVQNRFFRGTSYDLDLRAYCKDHNVAYQAFWMLNHNPEIVESDVISSVADALAISKQVAFYIMILSLGNTQVLDGTTKPARMQEDLAAIARVFNDDGLRKELEPFVLDFKRLLWKLAAKA